MKATLITRKPLMITIAIFLVFAARWETASGESPASPSITMHSLFSLRSVSFKCKYLQYAKSPNLQNETLVADNECAVVRDSERWRFYKRGHLTDLNEGKLVDGIQTYETLDTNGKRVTVGTLQMKEMPAEAPPLAVLVDFTPDKQGGRNNPNDLAVISIVFGSVPGDGGVTLGDLFTKQQVQRADSKLDGIATALLESTGGYGRLQVWLDVHDKPLRIETTKTGSDLLDTTSIDSRTNTAKGRIYPVGKLLKFRQVIDDMRFNSYSNVPVLTHFVCTATYEYESDKILTLRSDVQLSDVIVNPALDADKFKISTEIPNGTRVTDERHPQALYEWNDGEIVPQK